MTSIVFAGPSLAAVEPPALPSGIELRPPAACGDIARAVGERPAGIGLIDGYFEIRAAPWHKEILWALSQGIRVVGAASMGALRAAEMEPFGMLGLGRIFADYRDGRIEDDDEVAVLHGPAELGYAPLTEALVDIRVTLEAASAAGIVERRTAATLLGGAKALFYKERTWEAVLAAGARRGVSAPDRARLAAWLPAHRVEQKRLDALLLIDSLPALSADPLRRRDRPRFIRTIYWKVLEQHMAAGESR